VERGVSDAGGAADAGAGDAGPADAGPLDAGVADAGPAALRILFIGNSYTYVNDLPGMLTQIAATAGGPPTITTSEVVQAGAALSDHWANGVAQAAILDGGWTQVVLQGQSMEPLAQSSSYFLTYAEMFGDLIVDAGAQPTLFVTWARAAGDSLYSSQQDGLVCPRQMQDELDTAYAKVARRWPQSILACAGEAFQRSLARYPRIALQQSDLSHPTVAGTYLAASTFYVALTGKPVPPQSTVLSGLSAEDAASLRDIALVGSDCADAQVRGAAVLQGGPAFDFGTAGFPISNEFGLTNTGGMAVGIIDGMSLAPPFVWSDGGAYPGGSGMSVNGTSYCSSSLAPGSSCTISVTFTATSTASGALTLDFADAYLPSATLALSGTATSRAFCTVSDAPGAAFVCTGNCGPAGVSAHPGTTVPLPLFVMNRGALPVTSLGEGTPLSPPFSWGGGGFPGGVGSAWDSGSYPYCPTGTLGVGAQCALTIDFTAPDGGTYLDTLNLAYSDAMGPVSPDATRKLQGDAWSLPW
jgi:hypothetical protein